MRRLACSLGLLFISAIAVDCGPGPTPLMGNMLYSEGCRQVMDPVDPHPPCDTTPHNPNGVAGSGDPPLTVNCAVQILDGGSSRLRFTIASGGVSTGQGMSVCGTVPGIGMEMQNTRVDLYFGGEAAHGVTAPNPCHVKINSLTATGFDGQMQCDDVPGTATPTKLHFIHGIMSLNGQGGTVDPAWADFSFTSCTQNALVSCN